MWPSLRTRQTLLSISGGTDLQTTREIERDRPGRDMESFFTGREKERDRKRKRKHFSLVRTYVENAFGHSERKATSLLLLTSSNDISKCVIFY